MTAANAVTEVVAAATVAVIVAANAALTPLATDFYHSTHRTFKFLQKD